MGTALTGRPVCRVPYPLADELAIRLRIADLKLQLKELELRRGAIGMATVRMFGSTFTADVVKDNGDGTYLMRAKQHTGRTAPGTMFTANGKTDVVEMAAAEMPAPRLSADTPVATEFTLSGPAEPIGASIGLAELDKGMAEERKTITPAADIIAQHRAALKEQGVSVSSGPTQRR